MSSPADLVSSFEERISVTKAIVPNLSTNQNRQAVFIYVFGSGNTQNFMPYDIYFIATRVRTQ